MKWLAITVASTVALSTAFPSYAQDFDAKYICKGNLYMRYFLPDDRIIMERGKDAACQVELVPSVKKWETDCPFFGLRKNDKVELLHYGTDHGFWTIKLVAINRMAAVVKTMSISKLANRKNIQFTLAMGGNVRHGICASE